VFLHGALAGVAATVAMSGVMLLMQRLGLMGRTPPRQIVEDALRTIGAHRAMTRRGRKRMAAVAHLGFGATQGALFATLTRVPVLLGRKAMVPTATKGIAFGLVVWVSSYAGWIPLLGILPKPSRDRPGRPTSMILAHVVYGLALAKSVASLLDAPDRTLTGTSSGTPGM
jgi:uncharacterized membrane protein YagU involved in acid resistance